MVEPLRPHPVHRRRPGPVVLVVMDGVGLGAGGPDDAVATANTPHLDRLLATEPWCSLRAHGTAVGLPSDDDLGNSEVGHNALGAGRVFDQGAKLVNRAIASGEAWRSPAWRDLVATPTLHLLGLVSDGNVHSHVDHLVALVERAATDGVRRLRVHALTDGRDVAPRSALTWLAPLEDRLAAHRAAGRDYRVGSGGGRMHVTMDRYEADWEMVARGMRCHAHGEGRRFASATAAVTALYAENPGLDDQWLPAFVVEVDGEPCGRIADGDGVLLFNFRGDRAIEISRAFEGSAPRVPDTPRVVFAGMMEYDGDLHVPERYLVAPPAIDRTVGEFLAAAGLRTLAVSETQKFGHVTYFFNGNKSGLVDAELERYVEIPSDTRPFHERPWMRAAEIADVVVDALASGGFDHIRLNFANGDMVGHTGDLEATRAAVAAVDIQLGRLVRAVTAADGVLLVTADHGNADEMWMRKGRAVLRDPAGHPLARTAHSLAPVPFVLVDPRGELTLRRIDAAGLANVAATILTLLGLEPPADYRTSLV
jgi:2,3-bisphosphoglycerate-independent phosphoglycerate mutase